MFKPLIPIVSDALAHTFNKSIHIGTVHAIYGSNHLAIAVASAASEDNNKHQTIARFEDTTPLHIVTENSLTAFITTTPLVTFALFRIKKRATVYLSLQLPPPKFFL